MKLSRKTQSLILKAVIIKAKTYIHGLRNRDKKEEISIFVSNRNFAFKVKKKK